MFKLLRKLRKLLKSDSGSEFEASISVTSITRASKHVEQIGRNDNSIILGRVCWSSAMFTASINPFDYTDIIFKEVILSVSADEQWKFHNAIIALVPDGITPESMIDAVQQDQLRFVLIFKSAERILPGSPDR